MSTSYAVLGTGAVGGFYGGLLARAGHDVHFLVRSDYEHVRDHGLRVDSPRGDFCVKPVQAYRQAQDLPQVDVVIVAWKTTANAALAEALSAVCHERSIVLVLQNGLDVEQAAAEAVGAERVLGGCCFLCCNKVGPGHIHHLDYGGIAFGEYSSRFAGQVTERMHRLAETFQAAGISMQAAAHLELVRWKKLVWNVPFNGLSVVLGADTQQIVSDPQACQLAQDLMREVRQAALANNVPVPESHVDKMLSDTRKMVPYASSMLLDFRNRRPIEVEAIFGTPLRRSISAGYHPYKLEMLYQQLCAVDRLNRGESALPEQ